MWSRPDHVDGISGNICRGGGLNAIVMDERVWARHFPVRKKNGTPAQRQWSMHTRAATNGARVGQERADQ